MNPETQQKYDQTLEQIKRLCPCPDEPPKHTEADALGRNMLQAMVGLELEEDSVIEAICDEIQARVREFMLDTDPAELNPIKSNKPK